MPTVAAGTSASATLAGSQTIALALDPNEEAQVSIARSGAQVYGASVRTSMTIGPYLSGDVLTITAARGAVDYTLASYSDPVIDAVESAAIQALVSGAVIPEAYGAVTGGADATAAIQAAIDAASAAYNATTGARATVYFQPAIYGITGLLLKPNVNYNFGAAYFKKLANGSSVPTNSMLRTVDSLVGGSTYYGNFDRISILGGTFDTNGFTCPAQILRFENVRDFRIEGTKVVHSAACQSWAFQIGGQRVECIDLTVFGGNALFQDGIHITHGDRIMVRGGYVESGDDPIALGIDSTSTTETWDDEALTNVTIIGVRVKAERGTIKVYYGLNTATGMPFAGSNRGKIDGVVISGVVGSLGRLSNGAIYIQDTQTLTFTAIPTAATSGTLNAIWTGPSGVYNLGFVTASGNTIRAVTLTNGATTATWTGAVTATSATVIAGDASRIKNIQITGFDLTSGSAASDGVNANGLFVMYATNVKIHGTIRIIDTTSGSKHAVARCTQLIGADISLQVPALPAGPGLALFDSLDVNIHDGKFVGGGGSGRGSVEITGSRNTKIHHMEFLDIPTNGAAVVIQGVGSGNYANTLNLTDNTATKASGASITRFLITQSAAAGFLVHLNAVNNDLRGQSNATAIDQMFNTTGMNPDLFSAVGNRGNVVNCIAIGAVALAYSGTLTPPLLNQAGQRMQTTLGGAATVAAPGIALAGIRIVFEFTQDATGGRALSWNAVYKGITLAASGTVSQKASIEFECDGTNWIQKSTSGWY